MTNEPKTQHRGADIEIYETVAAPVPVARAKYVRINGVDVGLIAAQSLKVELDNMNVATVTLTLLPRSLRIHSEVQPTTT